MTKLAVPLGLHSLTLVVADIAGIAGGALAAFRITDAPNQFVLQVPFAVVLTVALFSGWLFSLRLLNFRMMALGTSRQRGVCLALSLLWAPLVFVPLHYFTQGYLTAAGNLVTLALYQLPVNALALFAPWNARGS